MVCIMLCRLYSHLHVLDFKHMEVVADESDIICWIEDVCISLI